MIKGQVPSEKVDKVLERLSTDHGFREHFLGDPAGALAQHGIEVDPAQIPAVRKLPPMEEVAKVREQAGKVDNPIEKVGLFVFMLQ